MTSFIKGSRLPAGYSKLLKDIKNRIRNSRVKAALSVNRELVLLYWNIGRAILNKQQKEGWGAKVIDRLAKDLHQEFPEMKGFSSRNLKYMRAFAEVYSDKSFVQQVAAQIPWFHNCILLDKIKASIKREWYLHKTAEYGWSRAVLVHQIESGLYERQGKATTNFERTLPSPQSDLARQLLKDPYNFAFVGSQVHIEVGKEDFFIDLLFYHLQLRSYVVIELKAKDFRPEFAGKMNFYLSAVDDLLRHPEDRPSIGIILCKKQNRVVAEYALRDMNKPIGISAYKLTKSLPKKLKGTLPTIKELEEELCKEKIIKIKV